jgi:hypothetical protein
MQSTLLLTSLLLATSLSFLMPVNAQSIGKPDSNQQVIVDPQTLENLKLLRDDLTALNKDSLIVATATQRRVGMHALSDNLFGTVSVVSVPPPDGYLAGGPAPPNLGLLKAVVIDMHSRLSDLTQTAKTVVVPNGVDTDASHKWMQTLSLINQTVKHYNQLEQLCIQPKVDRLRLGKETLAMYEDTGRAQHLSRSVYASLKNASKGDQNVLLVGKKRSTY